MMTTCPLKSIENCSIALDENIEGHFKEKHCKNVITHPFEWKRNWANIEPEWKCMEKSNKHYLYLEQIDDNQFCIQIMNLKSGTDSEQVKMVITKKHVSVEYKIIISSNNKLCIPKSSLQRYFGASECIVRLVFTDNRLVLSKSMAKHLKCPACKNLMMEPIFQCPEGHCICHNCRSELEQCPVCKTTLGNTRAIVLEKICNGFLYFCKYRGLGCQMVIDPKQLQQHEGMCQYQTYQCPTCDKMVPYTLIKSHLVKVHQEKLYSPNKITVPFDEMQSCTIGVAKRYYVQYKDELLVLVISVYEETYIFHLQLLSQKNENSWHYKVSIVDKNNVWKFSITERCQNSIVISVKDLLNIDDVKSFVCKIKQ